MRRDDQLTSATDLHPGDTLVPTLDDPAGAKRKVPRLSAVVGGVELLAGAVGDPDVVNPDVAARGCLSTIADGDVGDLEVGRWRTSREVDFWFLSHDLQPMTSDPPKVRGDRCGPLGSGWIRGI